jgi:TonB family protein
MSRVPVAPPLHVDSFFPPRQSGTWMRSTGTDPVPWRPQIRPPPPPPPPARSSRPAAESRALGTPRLESIAPVVLYLEEERDAGLPVQRRLPRPTRLSIGACGALLVGATLIWAPTDSFEGDSTAARDRLSPSRASRTRVQTTVGSAREALASTPQPQLVAAAAKPTLSAIVARGAFRHRAGTRRAAQFASLDSLDSAGEADTLPPAPRPDLDGDDSTADERDLEGMESASRPSRASPRVGRTVMRAVLISSSRPQYPRGALKRGIEGSVIVRFTIDARGAVRDAAVEHSSPPGMFDRAALRAIQSTRYQPRTEDGVAVETPTTRKRFTFQMRSQSH